MANFLYVDNSNVWIEGKRLSAVVNGKVPSIEDAQKYNLDDATWRIDYRSLLEFAGGEPDRRQRAVLFGSGSGEEAHWRAAEFSGFEPIVHVRNAMNREKKVDATMIVTLLEDSYERVRPGDDCMTLVTGDADFVPAIESIRKRGIDVHLAFWGHASWQLRNAATKFINMNSYFKLLSAGLNLEPPIQSAANDENSQISATALT